MDSPHECQTEELAIKYLGEINFSVINARMAKKESLQAKINILKHRFVVITT